MHADRTGLDAGSGVWNSQSFQESLDRAIFTTWSVQREKYQADLLVAQILSERRSDIDGHCVVATMDQRPMHRGARPERHIALSRSPPHQHPDAGAGQKGPLCRSRLAHTATSLLRF